MEYALLGLAPYVLVGLIIYLIFLGIQRMKHLETLRKAFDPEKFKKGALIVAIAVLIPYFVVLTASSLISSSNNHASLVLVQVSLATLFLVAVFVIRRVKIIATAIAAGSFLTYFYSISVYFPDLSPSLKTLVAGLILVGISGLAYWYDGEIHKKEGHGLKGFLGFVVAVLVLTFCSVFGLNLNATINPEPAYPTYSSHYNDTPYSSYDSGYDDSGYSVRDTTYSDAAEKDYDLRYDAYQKKQDQAKQNSFIIGLILGVLYLMVGVIIRKVGPLTVGFVLSGLMIIVGVLIESFDYVGPGIVAGIVGVAVVALIAFAYMKFGKEDHHNGDSSTPPVSPTPPLEPMPLESPQVEPPQIDTLIEESQE